MPTMASNYFPVGKLHFPTGITIWAETHHFNRMAV
jgi:hypothetical protein